MEDITKRKQMYLRSEIIEGGFDPGEFVEFLAGQRDNGEDVEVWSMQSLEYMVEQFKQRIAPKQEDTYEVTDEPEEVYTPEKAYETPAQLSARAQSIKNNHIRDDSEDEDEKLVEQAEKALISRSSAKDENQMAEDYIRRTTIDTKEAQAATNAVSLMSETERQKKELLDRAVQDKKSTIVFNNYLGI
jgi:hypothetical protein